MCTVLGQVFITAAISGLNDSWPVLFTDNKYQRDRRKNGNYLFGLGTKEYTSNWAL